MKARGWEWGGGGGTNANEGDTVADSYCGNVSLPGVERICIHLPGSPVNDCRQVPESVGPELIRWLPGRNCRHKELHPSCTQQQWVKETVPRDLIELCSMNQFLSLVMISAR